MEYRNEGRFWDRVVDFFFTREEVSRAEYEKRRRIWLIAACGVCGCVGLFFLVRGAVLPGIGYLRAQALYSAEEYDEAAEAFAMLNGAFDSTQRAEEIKASEEVYYEAKRLQRAGDVTAAAELYAGLGSFGDCEERLAAIGADYQRAEQMLTAGDYEGAAAGFAALGNYAYAPARLEEAKGCMAYEAAEKLYEEGKYEAAAEAYRDLADTAALVLHIGEERLREGVVKSCLALIRQCLEKENYDGCGKPLGMLDAFTVPERLKPEWDALRAELARLDFAHAQELLKDGACFESIASLQERLPFPGLMTREQLLELEKRNQSNLYAALENAVEAKAYGYAQTLCGYLPGDYEQTAQYAAYCGLRLKQHLTADDEGELTKLADMDFLDAEKLKKEYLAGIASVEGEWWYTGAKTREGLVSDGTMIKLTIGDGGVAAQDYEIWMKGWNGRHSLDEVMEMLDAEPQSVQEALTQNAPYTGTLAYDLETGQPCILAKERGSMPLAPKDGALFIDYDVFTGDVGNWRRYGGCYFKR